MNQATLAQTRTYTIDPNHSAVHFWARHMMISKVHGDLTEIAGTVKTSLEKPELSEIDVTIAATSLTTRNEQRDAHLKSADFLEVERFPKLAFRSTSVRQTGTNAFEVKGDLTIKDVTKPVTLKVETTPEITSHFGGHVMGVTASGALNREDFGMTWNQAVEAGGVLVGKEIAFTIDAELVRQD